VGPRDVRSTRRSLRLVSARRPKNARLVPTSRALTLRGRGEGDWGGGGGGGCALGLAGCCVARMWPFACLRCPARLRQFTPNGRHLVCGSLDGLVEVYDYESGKVDETLEFQEKVRCQRLRQRSCAHAPSVVSRSRPRRPILRFSRACMCACARVWVASHVLKTRRRGCPSPPHSHLPHPGGVHHVRGGCAGSGLQPRQ
jgi:hypothetical protein